MNTKQITDILTENSTGGMSCDGYSSVHYVTITGRRSRNKQTEKNRNTVTKWANLMNFPFG